MPDPKASELFEDAFRDNTGTIEADCELCGVHIFCSGPSAHGYEPGELEKLQAKAKAEPTKYVEWSYDGVSLGRISGKQFILDHECPQLGQYERFIWSHRFEIAEYLQKRARQELDDKTIQAEALGSLKDNIDEGIIRIKRKP